MAGAEGGSEGGEDVSGKGLRGGVGGVGYKVGEGAVSKEFEDEGCAGVGMGVGLE